MLWFLLALSLISGQEEKVIRAIKTGVPPKIDGHIEEIWAKADSVTEFIQLKPDEGRSITEKTVAYLLYDDGNLYVAFKCYDSKPEKLVLRTAERDNASGDYVEFFLDTFNNKLTGYGFWVSATGVQSDAYISSDGRSYDFSWDGVWYSEAKVIGLGYIVEIRIPFKSIRFKQGLSEWSVNFSRWIARKHEKAYWSPQKREEGFRVSRSGKLQGIYPGQVGLHLEAYPVALTRYEKLKKSTISPELGFDLTWYITPSLNFSLTMNPDFAQIEADPYRINLSKYRLYFTERRPFFLEDTEIFSVSGAVRPFYSRNIGKRLPGGKEVPILVGSKLTGKTGRFEVGALGSVTNRVTYISFGGDTLTESLSYYSVLSLRRQILENSTVRIIYAGKESVSDFNRVFSIDGALRTKKLQFSFQGAYAKRKELKSDYMGDLNLQWSSKNFSAFGRYKRIGENFDISEIGFAPWRGTENYIIGGGPKFYQTGIFKTLSMGLGAFGRKEYGDPSPGYGLFAFLNPTFINNWGFYFNNELGREYEIDRWYNSHFIGFAGWSDRAKPMSMNINFWYDSMRYNYLREYFAACGGGNFYMNWRKSPCLSVGFSINNTTEFKPDGSIEAISWILHPRVDYALRRDLHLRIYGEPNTYTHIHRLNLLLAWNFEPKSWLYFALNAATDTSEGNVRLRELIVVVKVRYLIISPEAILGKVKEVFR